MGWNQGEPAGSYSYSSARLGGNFPISVAIRKSITALSQLTVNWLVSRGQKARIYTDLTPTFISTSVSISPPFASPFALIWPALLDHDTDYVYSRNTNCLRARKRAWDCRRHDAGTHATYRALKSIEWLVGDFEWWNGDCEWRSDDRMMTIIWLQQPKDCALSPWDTA